MVILMNITTMIIIAIYIAVIPVLCMIFSSKQALGTTRNPEHTALRKFLACQLPKNVCPLMFIVGNTTKLLILLNFSSFRIRLSREGN